MSDMTTELEPVDLTEYRYAPDCEMGCGRAGTVIGQGCADKHPVVLCDECLDSGLKLISQFVHDWQLEHRRIFICGNCYRPVLRLDTHLDVRRLNP